MLLEEGREGLRIMKSRFPYLNPTASASIILLILISTLFFVWLIGKSESSDCINPLAQQTLSHLSHAGLNERKRITKDDYNELINNNTLTATAEEASKGSLEDVCESGNVTCLTDKRSIDNRVRYSTKHKLIGCMATNSMTEILELLMCYLYDQKTFTKAKNAMDSGSLRSYCQVVSEDHSLPKVWGELSERGVNIGDVIQYAVIQDPMERFLDNYLDHCIGAPNKTSSCSSCCSNITCFLKEKTKELSSVDAKSHLHSTFFSPQAWFCDFNRHFNEYRVITYDDNRSLSAVLENIKEISAKNGVNQDDVDVIQVHFDSRQEEDNEYRGKAKEFVSERIKSDDNLMKMFLQLYYVDYIKFGFEIP